MRYEDAMRMVTNHLPFKDTIEKEYGIDADTIPQEDYNDLIVELLQEGKI